MATTWAQTIESPYSLAHWINFGRPSCFMPTNPLDHCSFANAHSGNWHKQLAGTSLTSLF